MSREQLEHRERHERARLNAMIGYVERAPCRRRYLVDYFGDHRRSDRCEVCDQCLRPPPQMLEGKALEAAQIALSCIARMRGRFGKQRVVEVLAGSKSKPMVETRLDQLSTYGLLANKPKYVIMALLNALVRSELAVVTHGEYPRLGITDAGAEALRSRGPIELTLDAPSNPTPTQTTSEASDTGARRKSEPVSTAEVHQPTLEALQQWRGELARERGVPAYIIAHNALLAAVASHRPDSLATLADLKGMGPSKLEKFGEDLLEIVARVRRH